eukprot:gnl/TRDRNA2_/TRDRNA2_54230_c0_seq1.p1 gnl/TRDRNA2_/TRDRNA2_54230_c0~~gnl/TRDRNA2_/TRDRNA2_54230_c0_seq1.p1  ORF type:complete len:389 (+),score=76.05 gnl/TRDRNA2_/TRDRNA2_54230_c0_seq1:87-1169(+)
MRGSGQPRSLAAGLLQRGGEKGAARGRSSSVGIGAAGPFSGPALRRGSGSLLESPAEEEFDLLGDALDDLLADARSALKRLDHLRAQAAAAPQQHAPSKPPATGVSGQRSRRAAGRVGPAAAAGGFWQPRCDAKLWRGLADDDVSLPGSDEDLESSDVSEDEDDEAWAFLRSACGASAADPRPARIFAEPHDSARKAAAAAAVAAAAKHAAASGGNAVGSARGNPLRGGPELRASGGQARAPCDPGRPPQPNEEAKRPAADHRGRAAGFRFGGAATAGLGSGGSVPSTGGGGHHESAIRAALVTAQTEGNGAVRKVLKQLLLKWHPDKAPQGDSPADAAARAEATQVLRFILQERERLNL